MLELSIPEKLVRLVDVSVSRVEFQVRVQLHLPDPFLAFNSLRQDYALAWPLFNIALQLAWLLFES
jgi:hypothetical protein